MADDDLILVEPDDDPVDPEELLDNVTAAEGDEREQLLGALRELEDNGVELIVDGGPNEPTDVAEAAEFLEALLKMSKANAEGKPKGQWAVSGGNYTMVGDTTAELPPGFYDLASSQGQLFFVPMRSRTDKLLRFPHAEVDTVIEEIETFWAREAEFEKFGMSFKRGILMYGPPGSGKTCATQLLARDVVNRGGIVLVYDPNLFPLAYRQVRRVQPETPIVALMEDLDAILEHSNESVTLNLLDGTERLHRVIFVATTNYPQKLDKRVVNRPSRFDRIIRVGHPDDVGRRMYVNFLLEKGPEALSAEDVERYVKATNGMSLAHLKELFVATVLIGIPFDEVMKRLKQQHIERPTSLDDDKENERELGGYS